MQFTLYKNRREWAAEDNPVPVDCQTLTMAKLEAKERGLDVIDWPEGLLVRAPGNRHWRRIA